MSARTVVAVLVCNGCSARRDVDRWTEKTRLEKRAELAPGSHCEGETSRVAKTRLSDVPEADEE
jgi:hypothetical protein